MKIRAITIGILIQFEDFDIRADTQQNPENRFQTCTLFNKIKTAKEYLLRIKQHLELHDYEVQTTRICFNSIEEWLPLENWQEFIKLLLNVIEYHDIGFCSLGNCQMPSYIEILPSILAISERISASITFNVEDTDSIRIAPSYDNCLLAAKASIELFHKSGDLGNFRLCASFNSKPNTPFFPVAYHNSMSKEFLVSIGLENADLLFLSFYGADSCEEGSNNLLSTMKQCLQPVQSVVEQICHQISVKDDKYPISYHGIDASINPGLSLPDSVGSGIEHLIFPKSTEFGSFGTLAAVSSITKAVKDLPSHGIELCGYSGLMLPVMEDLILSERANKNLYSLRDLLLFSSVCGVGLDTVPIPGDTSPERLAAVYYETGALAFRLNKPLSCRLLPMKEKKVGEFTDVNSPYLCNTKVFSI